MIPFEYVMQTQYQFSRNSTTIYMKNKRRISEALKTRLNFNEGELFLYRIKNDTTAKMLASVLLEVGEIYVMRFKINIYGKTRGFAYVQYMQPEIAWHAMHILRNIFKLRGINAYVCESKNPITLVLNGADKLSPHGIYNKLNNLIKYKKLRTLEYDTNKFIYHIIFENKKLASLGHARIFPVISAFGTFASIKWLDTATANYFDKTTCSTNTVCFKLQCKCRDKVQEINR